MTVAVAVEVEETVGCYRILERVGGTVHGVCYIGACSTTGRQVSIEVLSVDHGRMPLAVEAYFNELRLLNAIRHPGIIEILDLGFTTSGRPYLVSELLVGCSLAERVADLGRFSVEQALAITRKIASALAAAHARGIVHRDLTPDSVFVTADDAGIAGDAAGIVHVKLLGFGRARLYRELALARRRRGMDLVAHASRRALVSDHRGDLHALGRMLFEMLIGRRPDAAEADLPSAAAPRSVHELVASLLADEPALRPRSAALVAAAIDAALVDLALQHRSPPPRRSGTLIAASALVVAVLIAICFAGVALGAYVMR